MTCRLRIAHDLVEKTAPRQTTWTREEWASIHHARDDHDIRRRDRVARVVTDPVRDVRQQRDAVEVRDDVGCEAREQLLIPDGGVEAAYAVLRSPAAQ